MPQTLAMFVLALRYISDVAAGPLASLVISHLRARFPPPSSAPASPLARLALFALWSPRYARISAMVLAAIISIPCALLAGFAQGEAVLPLADALLAAALSQVFHAFTDKSAEVPYRSLKWRSEELGVAGGWLSAPYEIRPYTQPEVVKQQGPFIAPIAPKAAQEGPNDDQPMPAPSKGA